MPRDPEAKTEVALARRFACAMQATLAACFMLATVGASTAASAQPLPDNARDLLGLAPCVASGKGHDFQVGPAKGQLATLDRVPWRKLGPGDTVRIFHQESPYFGKFMISARGRVDAKVRICGVRGANGERPFISGRDAIASRNDAYGHPLHESRSVIIIKQRTTDDWTAYPQHVQIDGLRIEGAHPSHSFTDSKGVRKPYEEFGACVWVERGQSIAIIDNEIADCSHAIFTKSVDEGDFTVTRDIRIAGNHFRGNGITGNDRVHTTYVQSVNVLYEFNRYGALREGARGNSIKDRSVGTVVRYNRIEDGARAIDLVEAEDFAEIARADPAYRTTFVYGNQIIKPGEKGSTIHYGGDHNGSSPGDAWGEVNNRKGTLYFFHNTVRLTGSGYGALFQLSTTEEKADVRNNIFLFERSIEHPRMRANTDVGSAWTAGGIITFARNWIDERWSDAGPWHKVGGELIGTDSLVTGSVDPVDLASFRPKAGSVVIDAAVAAADGTRAHPVLHEIDRDFLPKRRAVVGSALDLGAVEFE